MEKQKDSDWKLQAVSLKWLNAQNWRKSIVLKKEEVQESRA